MPRPPKSQLGPTAVERMEDAFWEELSRKPYDKITIADIVKDAQVNRNVFYYHFGNMDTLARRAARGLLETDAPRMLMEGINGRGDSLQEFVTDKSRQESLKRMLMLANKRTPYELRALLQDALVAMWCESFGVSRDDLGEDAQLTMKFAISGMFEVLGDCAESAGEAARSQLAGVVYGCLTNLRICTLSIAEVRRVLEDVREGKTGGRGGL